MLLTEWNFYLKNVICQIFDFFLLKLMGFRMSRMFQLINNWDLKLCHKITCYINDKVQFSRQGQYASSSAG